MVIFPSDGQLRGNDNVLNTLLRMTEALPSEARHETRAGVVLPFSGCRFRTHHDLSCGRRDEDGELHPIRNSGRYNRSGAVHAVVVDMPQRASLEYASPESWGTLPTFDPPNEESPTKPVLQVALN